MIHDVRKLLEKDLFPDMGYVHKEDIKYRRAKFLHEINDSFKDGSLFLKPYKDIIYLISQFRTVISSFNQVLCWIGQKWDSFLSSLGNPELESDKFGKTGYFTIAHKRQEVLGLLADFDKIERIKIKKDLFTEINTKSDKYLKFLYPDITKDKRLVSKIEDFISTKEINRALTHFLWIYGLRFFDEQPHDTSPIPSFTDFKQLIDKEQNTRAGLKFLITNFVNQLGGSGGEAYKTEVLKELKDDIVMKEKINVVLEHLKKLQQNQITFLDKIKNYLIQHVVALKHFLILRVETFYVVKKASVLFVPVKLVDSDGKKIADSGWIKDFLQPVDQNQTEYLEEIEKKVVEKTGLGKISKKYLRSAFFTLLKLASKKGKCDHGTISNFMGHTKSVEYAVNLKLNQIGFVLYLQFLSQQENIEFWKDNADELNKFDYNDKHNWGLAHCVRSLGVFTVNKANLMFSLAYEQIDKKKVDTSIYEKEYVAEKVLVA